MAWVHLVTLGALIEFFVFGWMVGRAREKYGVKAPAITGNEIFERYFRVQQNTLELLIVFIPALWVAAQYWNPVWVAAIGAVYIIGRAIYCDAYVRDPARRTIWFLFSSAPVIVLIVGASIGAVRALLL
jgi:glutathione S-transferase